MKHICTLLALLFFVSISAKAGIAEDDDVSPNVTSTACYSALFALDIMKSDKTPAEGISAITTSSTADAVIYDLQGRRTISR